MTLTGILKDWTIITEDGDHVLRATVVQDFDLRFEPGTVIATSALKRISFEDGVAETRNSRYALV